MLETAHTVVIWSFVYSLTVINYGKPETINDTTWSLSTALLLMTLLGATVQGIVQSFFGYRVWVLSGRLTIPAITWLGSIIRLGFGGAATAGLFDAKTTTSFLARDQWMVTGAIVISTLIDIINTSALCICLQRRRSGFNS
ncbi:hypothetical protein JB92DRAFT_2695157 [Gautieria morchelliformis]|nr:hypothetical protein JB92DRAFT_2695157 [Gautieria morchelliformis]